MPRRPTRRLHFPKPQPFVFSAFGRSVAAATFKHKRQTHNPNFKEKVLSKSSDDDKFLKHSMKDEMGVSESSDEEEHNEIVQADFAFFDPKPDDFHGVKILLLSYLDNKQWDLSGFVDLILAQTTVGTVVKLEDADDDGLFSVVTALNMGRYKDHRCITELNKFLIEVCQEKDVLSKLRLILGEEASNVGLLVSQRVANLPPQLLPPLYDALFDEASWATEDEPTEELQDSFRFKFYLVLTRIYKHKDANRQKGISKYCSDEPIIYIKPEDEIFHKLSSWSFNFPLQTQQMATHELRNYRLTGLVMAVEADKIPTFRKDLKSLISES
ncbi:protein BCCIP homolog [Macadamia integrifolia]|uniref:protein BCCIP homolog n=1 Tax=Macadamia integrifolia TaxID=60698 RepID=UPI001C4E64DA|nr:protein BCCIP homolog [Macadamia integrifolia]XP_042488768.1 protein BCCIP homolog [Macadamia integrifolia]